MKIDETQFRVALKGICSFARGFTAKRAYQASKQFGETKEWMILKALHCLEEHGFYKSGRQVRPGGNGGSILVWICSEPNFLEGKVYGPPVDHGLALLREWKVQSHEDRLQDKIKGLPAGRQADPLARLVAMVNSAKHCLAIRSLSYRARIVPATLQKVLEQWSYRGIVYMDQDSKGPAIRRTSEWSVGVAFDAIDHPATLQYQGMPLAVAQALAEPVQIPLEPEPPATLAQVEQAITVENDVLKRAAALMTENDNLRRLVAIQEENETLRHRLGLK
jgi:hypothetical protein